MRITSTETYSLLQIHLRQFWNTKYSALDHTRELAYSGQADDVTNQNGAAASSSNMETLFT